MKVLVTGYAGQLGYEVVRLLESRGVPCKGVDIADFSLTDAASVLEYVQQYAPDVIVHCAAYTNVDKAETEPEIRDGTRPTTLWKVPERAVRCSRNSTIVP